ncbi:MAG: carbonic anhydrase [Gemmatimonadota bacterium]
MAVIDELLVANRRFSGAQPQHQLPMPPARKLAALACMGARLDPAQVLGLAKGDAHVIRNPGGRARDSVRSLVVSQRLPGTTANAVVRHPDCETLTFTNPTIHARIQDDRSADASDMDLLPFGNVEVIVREDLALLRYSTLITPDTEIRGFIYDVKTGGLSEVDTPVSTLTAHITR